MDGLEFIKQLPSVENTKAVPVIMITTEGSEAHVVQALSCGARGYICKPFTPDQVKNLANQESPIRISRQDGEQPHTSVYNVADRLKPLPPSLPVGVFYECSGSLAVFLRASCMATELSRAVVQLPLMRGPIVRVHHLARLYLRASSKHDTTGLVHRFFGFSKHESAGFRGDHGTGSACHVQGQREAGRGASRGSRCNGTRDQQSQEG